MALMYTLPFAALILYHVITLVLTWRRVKLETKKVENDLSGAYGNFPDFPAEFGTFGDELLEEHLYTDTDVICGDGIFLSEDEYPDGFDCPGRCHDQEYEYRYISEKEHVNLHGVGIKGSWCLLKRNVHCNTNLSMVVIGAGRYECLSLYPHVFGGPYGSHIVGCAPTYTLVDTSNRKKYEKYIPYDLRIDDLDERLENGSYRYQCETYLNGNQYIDMQNSKLGSRFHTDLNTCDMSADGVYNFETLKCRCKSTQNSLGYVEQDEPCMPEYAALVSRDRFKRQIACAHPFEATYEESIKKPFACGIKTMGEFKDDATKHHHRGIHTILFDITTSYPLSLLDKMMK